MRKDIELKLKLAMHRLEKIPVHSLVGDFHFRVLMIVRYAQREVRPRRTLARVYSSIDLVAKSSLVLCR